MALCSSRRIIIRLARVTSCWSRCSFSSQHSNSSLFPSSPPSKVGYGIEVVDDDAWHVSTGLAQAWHQKEMQLKRENLDEKHRSDAFGGDVVDVTIGTMHLEEEEADFDDIDNMRMRGNLFYKLEKTSMEFEEYSFDFHRKKSPKRKEDPRETTEKEKKMKKNPVSDNAKLNNKLNNKKTLLSSFNNEAPPNLRDNVKEEKRVRTPTFNQLTAPYHLPFCLDIFISNASVRACVIHRVTSNVVAVAHSISKDMKFDLRSTKNAAACAAVGEVVAQRALADDIHNLVYTPRRGDVIEGKLQIVLQSIIDNGVNVKVKLKQRKQKKYHQHVYHR